MAKVIHRRRNLTLSVKTAEKHIRALQLRKSGMPYREIAAKLGYSGPSSAFNAVEQALRESIREPADSLRTLELERLDTSLLAIWKAVQAGSLTAIDRALKIMERRAKLLGLDRPTVSPTLNIDYASLTDVQLDRLVNGEDIVAVLAGSTPSAG